MSLSTVKGIRGRNYDFGWNARIKNKPFNFDKSEDWKDGWNDCNSLTDERRRRIGKL